jgi:hypothetical protein
MQRDPNETALVLEAVARDNAENASVFAGLMPRGQYRDGMGLYLYLASNPSISRDPLGLYRDFDWWEEFDDQESEWIGQRLYALGTINEGARWAALGLQTTLDIAGALLGVDVFESVSVLASGGGGFWDAMNIFMAVAPVGHLGKVAGKLNKAFKTARRAGKGSGLAASAARHLFKILPYRQAQKLTRGWGGDIAAHHILEGRHLKNWGRSAEIADAPAVILTWAEHNRITQALRAKLPYKSPRFSGRHEKEEVWAAYQEVYTRLGYPEWLDSIEKYFR